MGSDPELHATSSSGAKTLIDRHIVDFPSA
jgi:hypothetical protein